MQLDCLPARVADDPGNCDGVGDPIAFCPIGPLFAGPFGC